MDLVDYFEYGFGSKLAISELPAVDRFEESLDWIPLPSGHPPKRPKEPDWHQVQVVREARDEVALVVHSVVESYQQTKEGLLIHALEIPWRCIVERLNHDWREAMKIPPRIWEEMIAAAFDKEGYDEVTLTPRSGDHGRDVIAVRKGVGCVRIIDSVKAYRPGHLVSHDDVRSLAGVLLGDHGASKGILSTTSDFAPRIKEDPFLSPLMPFRLELMNGSALQTWLSNVAKQSR